MVMVISVRFAPPLVISEEDLRKAVKTIGECLADLDVVRILSLVDVVLGLISFFRRLR